ncbi:type II toxin-antitoxin system prevent-host-death family antitoxin [Microbacterium sp. NIBRBAC000506063]|uniref:type II toxin-antitoxin system Phd/YefM family antitoxin n=1 Tax=Microbacterium sp. NIBRBAC000506063 TaxID=2734618 RepID=UPI002948C013|nr:type II toxin-antitoxin system prevent-host-death family antitoxin [Microbacterium sp. NIBRBAC000506063]
MAITTSEARRDLFGLIERVNLDHTEVEITSRRGSAVLMSKDEYDSLVETSYLLRSPRTHVDSFQRWRPSVRATPPHTTCSTNDPSPSRVDL